MNRTFVLFLFIFSLPLTFLCAEKDLNECFQVLENNIQVELLNIEVPLEDLEASSYSEYAKQQKAKSYYSPRKQRRKDLSVRNSWVPHFEDGNSGESPSGVYFRTDLGLGLLYFSGIKGNLGLIPGEIFNVYSSPGAAPLRYRLMYNRSVLYESILGYRFLNYFRAGIGYLHQSNVTIQTKLCPTTVLSPPNLGEYQMTANLALDALLLKFYGELPWPLFMKNMMSTFYLGLGLGGGWQSWTDIQVKKIEYINNYGSIVQPMRQKISANVVFSADSGLNIRGTAFNPSFSLLLGCKFNIWGQALQIGKLSNQGASKVGMIEPFRIKTVYQWAPYLSAQWNFPNEPQAIKKYIERDPTSSLLTQLNVGPGFLYFKNIRGNLIGKPNQNGSSNYAWQTARVTSNVTYNRTPLLEYLILHRVGECFQLGVSYQNQANISFQTETVSTDSSSSFIADTTQLTSYLNLNSLSTKFYIKFPFFNSYIPFSTKKIAPSIIPYIALGFGKGWQTWNRIFVYHNGADLELQTVYGGGQPIKQKISANVVVNLDVGLQVLDKNPSRFFSVVAGAKYNYWGQARNIGKLSQQGSYPVGLNAPFTIKKVYQWAPYLGVQWNFPSRGVGRKGIYVGQRSPNTWKPYLVSIDLIQKNRSLLTQLNIGLGFLYFSGLQGNLMPTPSCDLELARDVPIRGKLAYNRTPLFEYILGYRLNKCFKLGLSFQHQSNVTVQTRILNNFANQSESGETWASAYSQFTSDLTLDALMAKFYFEYPKVVIFKNYAYSPYLAVAVGPTWQTWKRSEMDQYATYDSIYTATQYSLRLKVAASCGVMGDFGFRLQVPSVNSGFSTLVGLKFNFWGQARNLGLFKDQLTPRFGLSHPVRIKAVYQWAPYLGVQWNF
ncbi:MAG: hypothetical protein S4CHLAM7_11100 [Chlamydiae bacterium]|nr:hypothetical protein [Chlamydiota bacterium]